jgi:ubiquinone/menaquinone biosynthesis C-methylase UbiE
MSTKFSQELWHSASTAEIYYRVEDMTRPGARALLAQAGFHGDGARILDIGTGAGQVVEAILASSGAGDVNITAGDVDESLQ